MAMVFPHNPIVPIHLWKAHFHHISNGAHMHDVSHGSFLFGEVQNKGSLVGFCEHNSKNIFHRFFVII